MPELSTIGNHNHCCRGIVRCRRSRLGATPIPDVENRPPNGPRRQSTEYEFGASYRKWNFPFHGLFEGNKYRVSMDVHLYSASYEMSLQYLAFKAPLPSRSLSKVLTSSSLCMDRDSPLWGVKGALTPAVVSVLAMEVIPNMTSVQDCVRRTSGTARHLRLSGSPKRFA